MEDLRHGPDARDSLLRKSDRNTLSMAVSFFKGEGQAIENVNWGTSRLTDLRNNMKAGAIAPQAPDCVGEQKVTLSDALGRQEPAASHAMTPAAPSPLGATLANRGPNFKTASELSNGAADLCPDTFASTKH